VCVAVGEKTGERCRVIVDVADDKERRRSRLAARATSVAKEGQRTGHGDARGPLNPWERQSGRDGAAGAAGVAGATRGARPGLPGIVLALAVPELQVGLVESQRRRVAFLELAVESLELRNADVLPRRAEELEPGSADLCTARAFAPPERAWQVAEPLLAPGGR